MTKLKYHGEIALEEVGGNRIDKDGSVKLGNDRAAAWLVANRPDEFDLVETDAPNFAHLVDEEKLPKPPAAEKTEKAAEARVIAATPTPKPATAAAVAPKAIAKP